MEEKRPVMRKEALRKERKHTCVGKEWASSGLDHGRQRVDDQTSKCRNDSAYRNPEVGLVHGYRETEAPPTRTSQHPWNSRSVGR